MPRAQLCLDANSSNSCLVLSSCAWPLLLGCHGRGQLPGIAGALNLFVRDCLPPLGEGGSRSSPNEQQVALSCAIFLCSPALVFSPSLLAHLLSSISQDHTYNGSLKSCPSLATPLRNQADKTPWEW